jgi:hypothetical protein
MEQALVTSTFMVKMRKEEKYEYVADTGLISVLS